MRIIAEIISWVFLPLFMPVYGILILMYFPTEQFFVQFTNNMFLLPEPVKAAVFTIFVLFSIVLPGISFLLMRFFNIITTIDMENRIERNIPLFLTMSFSLILYIFLLLKANGLLPVYVYGLPLSAAVVTGLFSLINKNMKISLHAGSAGILTGLIVAYSFRQQEFQYFTMMFAFLASGLTLSARLYLAKHTQQEVYTGWSLAFIITFFINFIYPNVNF